MKVLIQKAHINDPGSAHHGKRSDIYIESGFIKDIQQVINTQADQVIAGDDLHVSPGWVDPFASFADPGYEYKETLQTGAAAAAKGGFTDVFVIPNTLPVTDTKAQIEYIRHKSASLGVNIHPLGAITRQTEGKDLAEMYDMRASGAVAFSDGSHPVQSAGVLVKALQYVKTFDGVIVQIPDDKSVGAHGLMHEGVVSTQLGLSGKPVLAEELLIARDIKLARYAGSRLHFTGVTSPKSLAYIQRAKDAGIQVTCSVTPYHLFFADSDIIQYDTNLKVYPPLRPKDTVSELRKAVENGVIDCIATHHFPHETDSKVVEFETAAFGMIGLETCYAALKTVLPNVKESQWAELLSLNARKIFGLDIPVVQKDSPAIVTIYQPSAQIKVNETFFRSRSRNSAFIGKELTGKVIGIVNKEKVFLTN
jgi:dihydroorotase